MDSKARHSERENVCDVGVRQVWLLIIIGSFRETKSIREGLGEDRRGLGASDVRRGYGSSSDRELTRGCCGRDWNRTSDFCLAKAALSQLSYTPKTYLLSP